MKRNAKQFLFDVAEAIERIEKLIAEKTIDDFLNDFGLQWAVERGLGIIGEATAQLRKLQPNIPISNLKQIISLRNFVVHVYFEIEPERIWAIVVDDLPLLKKEVAALLAE